MQDCFRVRDSSLDMDFPTQAVSEDESDKGDTKCPLEFLCTRADATRIEFEVSTEAVTLKRDPEGGDGNPGKPSM
jgi:hypothetical protein